MAIIYYKLFDKLRRRGLKRSDLTTIMSSKTISKFAKNRVVNTSTISAICECFSCQPGDIMEYVPDGTDVPYDDLCAYLGEEDDDY